MGSLLREMFFFCRAGLLQSDITESNEDVKKTKQI